MCRIQFGKLSFCFLLLNLFTQVISLQVIQNVPEYVAVGGTAKLSCKYDVNDDQIYTIKWYFDDKEFYRYYPQSMPQQQFFPVADLNVDMKKSNLTHIFLKNLTQNHSGNYTCEVSLDAPIFLSKTVASTMRIVRLPKAKPIIKADNAQLSLGDYFTATCTTEFTDSALKFSWYINGLFYSEDDWETYDTSGDSKIYETATSELDIYVNSKMIAESKNGSIIIVKCETHIYDLYRKSAELEFYIYVKHEDGVKKAEDADEDAANDNYVNVTTDIEMYANGSASSCFKLEVFLFSNMLIMLTKYMIW